jgi:hypothetical protein
MQKISAFWRRCWLRSRGNTLVIALGLVAIAVILFPVQHYLAVARYQHYGAALCIFASGYLLQTCVSWHDLKKWAKVSYLTTGLFFFALGVVLISNPWLDGRVSPRTEAHESLRKAIQGFYLLSGLIVTAAWFRLIYEDMLVDSGAKIKENSNHK